MKQNRLVSKLNTSKFINTYHTATCYKSIPLKRCRALAYRNVVVDIADCVKTASVFARVDALVIHAGFSFITVIINRTFRPTFYCRIAVIFRNTRTCAISTDGVTSTGIKCAGVYWCRRLWFCKIFYVL